MRIEATCACYAQVEVVVVVEGAVENGKYTLDPIIKSQYALLHCISHVRKEKGKKNPVQLKSFLFEGRTPSCDA